MDETPEHEFEPPAHVSVKDGPGGERAPSPPVRPPLRRRADGKWIAGVAGGLADHWTIPAPLLRLPLAIAGLVSAVVAVNVFTGEGATVDPSDGLIPFVVTASFAAVVAYFVLWIVLPSEAEQSPADRVVQRGRRLASSTLRRHPGIRSVPALVLLAIGGAILAERLGIWQPDLVLAAGLIALGVWLYRRDRAVPSDVRVVEPATDAADSRAVEPVAAAAPPIARPPRERSPLGWITFGVALLVVSVAAIWASLAGDTLPTVHRAVGLTRISTIPAVGLLVLAAGLLVGSMFGRARWLILPAVLVMPVVLVASVIRLPFDGEFGNSYARPGAFGESDVVTRRNAVGSVFVDLGRLDGRPEVKRELNLSTVLGTVTVVVPFDAHVRVDAFTGLGTIGLGPRRTQGLEVSDAAVLEPRRGDGATFIVHAEVGVGDVHLLRYSPTKRQLREIRREELRAERPEEAA